MSGTALLSGKVAVISGAASSRGLGFATAKLFAEHGAKVAILDINAKGVEEAAKLLGTDHKGYVCDVSDKASCEKALKTIVADFGKVDILINNAGITQPAKVCDIDEASWDRLMAVNLKGVLFLSQATIPYLKKNGGGAIACTSSVSAQRGGGILGGPHYSAAKAGVLGLAKAMARELGSDAIRVNCVTPGLIHSDINSSILDDARREEIKTGIPLNRIGVPSDVAGAFLFLASELSSYITGAVIDVNGGMLIH
ncbi:Uncharacterized short-chain type dehydrogenase/reductase y4mP [uncultured Pleomorphomonas sp.]|uniref:Uncharacterized short-chain type dehydrogenase/reductase y4mP n=1 Tax=uncultured Pleomorphomonas sp. TaxID=442121 RepID=A0A212LG58_9HYPH|nr:SDR family NAD(P)-dependent oxidoreductase [uncultured Pleomorphomonas sp.]SCM76543.1 Uncharacterized short-chain type dehydrogenase/reductase y4mP [uncultured Pleomorphomonas sp.]